MDIVIFYFEFFFSVTNFGPFFFLYPFSILSQFANFGPYTKRFFDFLRPKCLHLSLTLYGKRNSLLNWRNSRLNWRNLRLNWWNLRLSLNFSIAIQAKNNIKPKYSNEISFQNWIFSFFGTWTKVITDIPSHKPKWPPIFPIKTSTGWFSIKSILWILKIFLWNFWKTWKISRKVEIPQSRKINVNCNWSFSDWLIDWKLKNFGKINFGIKFGILARKRNGIDHKFVRSSFFAGFVAAIFQTF